MTTTFKSITSLIKEADNVIIMAHKNIDLDALGSALCLSSIVRGFKKEAYVCLNKKTSSVAIEKALELVKKSNLELGVKSKSETLKIIKKNTLLVILDTSKVELVECEELLSKISNKIVLDHHAVGNKNIKDTKISYINSNLSSTNEIMVGYLKYLNKQVSPIIATIMLAGMEVDTNSFTVKTTSATFDAAAHLLELGALNMLRQELLKEDKEQYLRREKYLLKSEIIFSKYAICKIPDIVEKEDIAVVAEKMILFDDVKASFAIAKINKNIVSISARSADGTDVYQIMKEFGGGGHVTEAAAQIEGTSVDAVEKELISKLKVIK